MVVKRRYRDADIWGAVRGAVLLHIAAVVQGCGGDVVRAGGDDENGGGLGGRNQGGQDAGDPRAEGDASIPDSSVDAGTGGGNGDADVTPALVTRQLCIMDGDTVRRVSFPSFEVVNEFTPAPVRALSPLYAVDPVHGEAFLERADGLDVFSLDASGLDAALRSIILPAEVTAPTFLPPLFLAVAVDTVNDTLVVLSTDEENFHLSTYPRNAANATLPVRRMDFAKGPLEQVAGNIAIDSERERIFVATSSRLLTFALVASGATAPLEAVELEELRMAISPSRDELHLAGPGTAYSTVTLDLDAPLDSPPLRSLEHFGALLVDDVNGELWVNGSAYDVEAVGAAEPLYTPPLHGTLRAVLPERGEWLTQNSGNVLLTYSRQPSPPVEAPLRVLAGGGGAVDLVGVHRGRGEVVLRDARSGLVSIYPIGATGSTPALRRFWEVGGAPPSFVVATYDEERGQILAPPVSSERSIHVYSDTAEGLIQPGPELARNLYRMEVASAPAELLGVKAFNASYDPVLEAYSLSTSSFRTLQRSFTIPSQRPNPDTCTWRGQGVIGMAFDPVRDEVIVAVQDCLDGGLECTGGVVEDCHFDLKIFPRTAGPDTPVQTAEVFYPVRSVEFDERNDLILLQGDDEVWFLGRTQLAGSSTWDAGAPPAVVERTSQGAGVDSNILYCD